MGTVTEYGVAYMTVVAAYPDAPQDWAEQQARRALDDPGYYRQLVLRVEETAQAALTRLEARLGRA